MPDFKQYFDEELRYLMEAGKEFAREFPDKAGYLNLAATDDRDPYVERLLEGFAFLTGRIREKLDDDFPEIAENILETVAPDFLRPVPSLSLVQFLPRPGMLQQSYTLPRGTFVLSNPVGENLTTCRFQTTQEVVVHPINLSSVEQVSHPARGNGLKFSFHLEEGTDLDYLYHDDTLPIFIHCDRSLSWILHYLLTEKISEVILEADDSKEQITGNGEPFFEAGGFNINEALLPEMKNALECGRYLREFFAFEEKFRFVNCKCLKYMKALSASAHFSFTVYFSQSIPPGKNVKSENFKLYVSPVVNLFEHQAEPIILDHRHFEYRIIPSIRDAFDVFTVTKVRGINKATGAEKNYVKFNEFRHLINEKGDKTGGNYYSLRREYMVGNEFKTYLSLGSHGSVEDYKEEYISISLLSTNSSLPRKEIKEGDICNPVSDFPDFIRFSNLTRPTTLLFPPHKKLFLWTLLSHMSMNFKTLCSRETLKEVLSLYDWKQSGTNRKLIQGILDVTAAKKDFMMGGQLIHGTEITVTFKDGTFNEAGEQNIFGKILLSFLSQYASINYLVALRFISEPSGLESTWEPEHGKCHLI